jgi:hypothetical protein
MKSDAEIRDDVINELHWDPQVTGQEAIGVAVRDGAVTLTGHVLAARALFVFIGVRPCSGSLGGLVDLDARGFVRTGQDTGKLRAGDEPAGHLRRGRRAQRLGQAGRHGGRRGRDGHQARLRKNPAGIAGRRISGREAQ